MLRLYILFHSYVYCITVSKLSTVSAIPTTGYTCAVLICVDIYIQEVERAIAYFPQATAL
jgi:hypothetical protein